jgi:hypothetical protein
VQITASVAAGGKSLSQHSQFGRSSSICHLASLRSTDEWASGARISRISLRACSSIIESIVDLGFPG